ncbi:MAG: hypothetical protein A2295_01255 [Candidatus Jacksonbacteria bacterium RIFOXYB2_FULL_44_15]|nr:MAG: hypothetical protein A2295_01255 [Candidatus Jacksonbacteria bacterium RIFOXYB2_FULL_44_15]OGY80249.1 MAG: hypothetical protein A2550_03920 [Candidatus Jacksonbacteria bacterium RIFOXYD2_FULL_43_21]HCE48987.1 hypothetical protein [Candidatus Jacksonbacteria bacterium]
MSWYCPVAVKANFCRWMAKMRSVAKPNSKKKLKAIEQAVGFCVGIFIVLGLFLFGGYQSNVALAQQPEALLHQACGDQANKIPCQEGLVCVDGQCLGWIGSKVASSDDCAPPLVYNKNISSCAVDFGAEIASEPGLGREASDIRDNIRRFLSIALGFAGFGAVIMIIYGGVLWMLSRGEADKVTKAKKTVIWSSLGLLIILISWTISSYVLNLFFKMNAGYLGPGNEDITSPFPVSALEYKFRVENVISAREPQVPIPPINDKLYRCTSLESVFNSYLERSNFVAASDGAGLNRLKLVKDNGGPLPGWPEVSWPTDVNEGKSVWQLLGQDILFQHFLPADVKPASKDDYLFEANKKYAIMFPRKVLSDEDSNFLNDCVASAGCQILSADQIAWEFTVGDKLDEASPELTFASPHYDKAYYEASLPPSRPPIISTDVAQRPTMHFYFSEPVLSTSLVVMDAATTTHGYVATEMPTHTAGLFHPATSTFSLYEIDTPTPSQREDPATTTLTLLDWDPASAPIDPVPNIQFAAFLTNDNQHLQLEGISPHNRFLLKNNKWYRLELSGIKDLCGNDLQPTTATWLFQVNGLAPGLFPTPVDGQEKVCPDIDVGVLSSVELNDPITGGCEVPPQVPPGYVSSGTLDWTSAATDHAHLLGLPAASWTAHIPTVPPGRTLKRVTPTCSIFEFRPTADPLRYDSWYRAQVQTSYPLPQPATTTMRQTWFFKTATQDEVERGECILPPIIDDVLPWNGIEGDCVSIVGRHFLPSYSPATPTAPAGAYITPAASDDASLYIPPNAPAARFDKIGVWKDNLITAMIPSLPLLPLPGFTKFPTVPSDQAEHPVRVVLKPPSGLWVLSREHPFRANDSLAPASGPCLLSVDPSDGHRGEMETLRGERFQTATATVLQNILYSVATVASVDDSLWASNQIITSVPLKESIYFPPAAPPTVLVQVQNDSGLSNPVPITIPVLTDIAWFNRLACSANLRTSPNPRPLATSACLTGVKGSGPKGLDAPYDFSDARLNVFLELTAATQDFKFLYGSKFLQSNYYSLEQCKAGDPLPCAPPPNSVVMPLPENGVSESNIRAATHTAVNLMFSNKSYPPQPERAYWPLDEGLGLETADESKNSSNKGIINGADWKGLVDCKVGKCLEFVLANSDYVAVGTGPIADGLAEFTLSSWVYVPALTPGAHVLFAKDKVISVGRSGGQLSAQLGDGSNYLFSSVALGAVPAGAWTHLAWVMEPSALRLRAYVDGVVAGVMPIPATMTLGWANVDNTIGNLKGTASYWDGRIDDLRIYRNVRTPAEIAADARGPILTFDRVYNFKMFDSDPSVLPPGAILDDRFNSLPAKFDSASIWFKTITPADFSAGLCDKVDDVMMSLTPNVIHYPTYSWGSAEGVNYQCQWLPETSFNWSTTPAIPPSPDPVTAVGAEQFIQLPLGFGATSSLIQIHPKDSYLTTATAGILATAIVGTLPLPAASAPLTIYSHDFCLSDDDCDYYSPACTSTCNLANHRCNPRVKTASPNLADTEDWVSVFGCYFGQYRVGSNLPDGKLELEIPTGTMTLASFNFPLQCPGTWSDDQIIAIVPPLPQTGKVRNILVTTNKDFGNLSSTPTFSGFMAGATITHPLLCGITPTAGGINDPITLLGQDFDTDPGVEFAAFSLIEDFSAATQIAAYTLPPAPQAATSTVALGVGNGINYVEAVDGPRVSNPLRFNVESGEAPQIRRYDPTTNSTLPCKNQSEAYCHLLGADQQSAQTIRLEFNKPLATLPPVVTNPPCTYIKLLADDDLEDGLPPVLVPINCTYTSGATYIEFKPVAGFLLIGAQQYQVVIDAPQIKDNQGRSLNCGVAPQVGTFCQWPFVLTGGIAYIDLVPHSTRPSVAAGDPVATDEPFSGEPAQDGIMYTRNYLDFRQDLTEYFMVKAWRYLPNKLTFNAGDVYKTFDVTIFDDASAENTEDLSFALSNPTSYAKIDADEDTSNLQIFDNDTATPTVGVFEFLNGKITVGEGSANYNIPITVVRRNGRAGAVNLQYDVTTGTTASATRDYNLALPLPGTLNFFNGESIKSFNLTLLPDALPESLLTLKIKLSDKFANIWQSVKVFPRPIIESLIQTSNGDLFAGIQGGGGGAIWKSTDGGVTWAVAGYNSATIPVFTLLSTRVGDAVYAGTSQGIYKTIDAGANWVLVGLTGQRVDALLEGIDGAIYAGSPTGKVSRSYDQGYTWIEVAQLIGMAGPVGAVNVLKQNSDGTIYAGTSGRAEVFKSTDSGNNWTNLGSLTGGVPGQVVSLYLDGGQTIYAGVGSNGQIFKSTNGGTSWINKLSLGVGTGNVAAIIKSSSGAIYATLSGVGGKVLKTLDGGNTWSPTGALTGPPLSAPSLLYTKAGEIFVGTGVGGELFKTSEPRLGTNKVVNINILDDGDGLAPSSGTFVFTGQTFLGQEEEGIPTIARLSVARVGGSNGTATVDYTLFGGSATPDKDYQKATLAQDMSNFTVDQWTYDAKNLTGIGLPAANSREFKFKRNGNFIGSTAIKVKVGNLTDTYQLPVIDPAMMEIVDQSPHQTTNVCANSSISLRFNQAPDTASLTYNIRLYSPTAPCSPTWYLARADLDSHMPGNWFFRLVQRVKGFFSNLFNRFIARAMLPSPLCSVPFDVKQSGSVVNVIPRQFLKPDTNYQLVVMADTTSTAGIIEGVKWQYAGQDIGLDTNFCGASFTGDLWDMDGNLATLNDDQRVCTFAFKTQLGYQSKTDSDPGPPPPPPYPKNEVWRVGIPAGLIGQTLTIIDADYNKANIGQTRIVVAYLAGGVGVQVNTDFPLPVMENTEFVINNNGLCKLDHVDVIHNQGLPGSDLILYDATNSWDIWAQGFSGPVGNYSQPINPMASYTWGFGDWGITPGAPLSNIIKLGDLGDVDDPILLDYAATTTAQLVDVNLLPDPAGDLHAGAVSVAPASFSFGWNQMKTDPSSVTRRPLLIKVTPCYLAEGATPGYLVWQFDDSSTNLGLPASLSAGWVNYEFAYCRKTADNQPRLPLLIPQPVPVQKYSARDVLREYFFYYKNRALDGADVFLVRIFPAANYFIAKEGQSALERWYNDHEASWFGEAKGTFSMRPTIDGYEAGQVSKDGQVNAVYVHALNINNPALLGNAKVYSNVYVLAINENASNATRKIFEQMINNWRFNINIVDGAGARDMAAIESFRNDSLRIQDWSSLADRLEDYRALRGTFPTLPDSRVARTAVSVWGQEWRLPFPDRDVSLVAALGGALPLDPLDEERTAGQTINQLNQEMQSQCIDCGLYPTGELCNVHKNCFWTGAVCQESGAMYQCLWGNPVASPVVSGFSIENCLSPLDGVTGTANLKAIGLGYGVKSATGLFNLNTLDVNELFACWDEEATLNRGEYYCRAPGSPVYQYQAATFGETFTMYGNMEYTLGSAAGKIWCNAWTNSLDCTAWSGGVASFCKWNAVAVPPRCEVKVVAQPYCASGKCAGLKPMAVCAAVPGCDWVTNPLPLGPRCEGRNPAVKAPAYNIMYKP